MRTRIASWAAVLCLLAPSSSADTLLTKDGRIIDGPPMERAEGKIIIHFEHGDVSVPDEMVQEVFIEAELEDIPKNRRRKIEKQIKEKREEIDEARGHSEWRNRYNEETANFNWQYTIPKHIAEGLQMRFEAYYKLFAKEWKLKRDKGKPKLPVNFYRDSAQFQRTSGAGGGTLAYFRFVEPYDLNACYDRVDPRETEMVLYHELSHYLQTLIDEKFTMPHWPGEGIAEYFSGALWNEKKKALEIGLIQEGRLTEVKGDIANGKYLSIRETVTKDAYTDYTWGWALVHFFMTKKEYKKGFQRYVVGMARQKGVKRVPYALGLRTVTGEESLRYLMECLKIKDDEQLEEVQKEYYAYVEDELQQEGASGLEKAAVAARRVGKSIRATRLFEEAEEAGGLSALGCYQYAQMVRYKNRSLAKKLYKQAIELDPLVGTYYYEYARLVEDDDEEEAKKYKGLAKELDPEVDTWVIDITFEAGDEDE